MFNVFAIRHLFVKKTSNNMLTKFDIVFYIPMMVFISIQLMLNVVCFGLRTPFFTAAETEFAWFKLTAFLLSSFINNNLLILFITLTFACFSFIFTIYELKNKKQLKVVVPVSISTLLLIILLSIPIEYTKTSALKTEAFDLQEIFQRNFNDSTGGSAKFQANFNSYMHDNYCCGFRNAGHDMSRFLNLCPAVRKSALLDTIDECFRDTFQTRFRFDKFSNVLIVIASVLYCGMVAYRMVRTVYLVPENNIETTISEKFYYGRGLPSHPPRRGLSSRLAAMCAERRMLKYLHRDRSNSDSSTSSYGHMGARRYMGRDRYRYDSD